MPDPITVPFARPFPVSRVASVAFDMHIEATPEELTALALFWEVEAVGKVEGELKISPWRRDGVRVRGEVSAHLVQSCVVTLEPVESDIVETIDATFLPETSRHFSRQANEEGELVVDPDGPDEPEPFSGGEIDVGALVAEAIALSIDPYPRKEGAELAEEPVQAEAEDDRPPSPFAALKDWKGGSGSEG